MGEVLLVSAWRYGEGDPLQYGLVRAGVSVCVLMREIALGRGRGWLERLPVEMSTCRCVCVRLNDEGDCTGSRAGMT